MRACLLLFGAFAILGPVQALALDPDPARPDVQDVIAQAREALLARSVDGRHFNFPAYLGPH